MEAAPLKWNRPRTIHWLIPVIFAIAFLSLVMELPSFRDNFGEDAMAAGNHLLPLFIFGAVFCGIYWFALPPKWPTRKPTKLEIVKGVAGVIVFLLLVFFEELVMPVLRWIGAFLDNKPAGLWIAFTFITALIALCAWGFRKSIMINIKTSLQTKSFFKP